VCLNSVLNKSRGDPFGKKKRLEEKRKKEGHFVIVESPAWFRIGGEGKGAFEDG
jgi:hypothetical protein